MLWLDEQYVVFGEIVEGIDVAKTTEAVGIGAQEQKVIISPRAVSSLLRVCGFFNPLTS